MPSLLMTLAALLLVASGAPVEELPADGLADSPAGETSGEEEVWPADLLSASPVWHSILGATKRHREQFENEFNNEVKYHFLENYKISSLPAGCPLSNFSKEACLHRLAQGLLTYTAVLQHVEKEYPGSLICSEVRYYSGLLINLTKEKMRSADKVTALSSSQEAQLLRDVDSPDAFHRKMSAHSILRQLHVFLIDCRRAVTKREKARGSAANRSSSSPVTFFSGASA